MKWNSIWPDAAHHPAPPHLRTTIIINFGGYRLACFRVIHFAVWVRVWGSKSRAKSHLLPSNQNQQNRYLKSHKSPGEPTHREIWLSKVLWEVGYLKTLILMYHIDNIFIYHLKVWRINSDKKIFFSGYFITHIQKWAFWWKQTTWNYIKSMNHIMGLSFLEHHITSCLKVCYNILRIQKHDRFVPKSSVIFDCLLLDTFLSDFKSVAMSVSSSLHISKQRCPIDNQFN